MRSSGPPGKHSDRHLGLVMIPLLRGPSGRQMKVIDDYVALVKRKENVKWTHSEQSIETMLVVETFLRGLGHISLQSHLQSNKAFNVPSEDVIPPHSKSELGTDHNDF